MSFQTMLQTRLRAAWLRRGPLAWALWPLSQVYRALAALRLARWQRRARRGGVVRLPVPVVVVGNVVAGGAGKTPVTLALADHLRQRGLQVGVISRGYGRRTRGLRDVQPDSTAADVGDEPLLIARHSRVPVAVAEDRPAAARHLLRQHPGLQVLLADDGLQHHALWRDVEICVLDPRGLGNGWLLPAGPLREPWPHRSAQTGDHTPTLLVLHSQPAAQGAGTEERAGSGSGAGTGTGTGTELASAGGGLTGAGVSLGGVAGVAGVAAASANPVATTPDALPANRPASLPDAMPASPPDAPSPAPAAAASPPVFHGQRTLADYAVRADGRRVPLAQLVGQPLHALAGIAQPELFFAALRQKGLTLAAATALPDHYDFDSYNPSKHVPQHLLESSLICTEKDAVKLWPRHPHALAVPLHFQAPPSFWAALDQALALPDPAPTPAAAAPATATPAAATASAPPQDSPCPQTSS